MAPKVPQKVLDEKPKRAGSLRRRLVHGERGDWGVNKGKESLRWMVVAAVAIIALVVLAVVMSRRPGKKYGSKEESVYSQIAPTEAEDAGGAGDLEMLELLTNSQDQARSIFATYATAGKTSEFMDALYDAKGNGELVGMRWKPLGMKAGWRPDDGAVWTVLERDGIRYGVLEGALSDFTRFSAYFRMDEGGLKMDWKATSGFGTADFDELKKGEGDGSEIRAWISRSDFYTFALPEGNFRSFRLMSPDGQSNLWGYTRVGGELDEKLLALFVPSQITGETQNDAAVVLGMQPGPEDCLPNQWMITNLQRLSWLDE